MSQIKYAALFWGLLLVGGIVLPFNFSSAWASPTWMDDSQAVFFPKGIGEKLETYQSFPAAWWNFVVVDVTPQFRSSPEIVNKFCTQFSKSGSRLGYQLPCGDEVQNFAPILQAWAYDIFLRSKNPGRAQSKDSLSATLSKASLPIGRDRMELLQHDPFGSYHELKKRLESNTVLDLPLIRGVFVDEANHRLAFPLQMKFPPAESEQTGRISQWLQQQCQKIQGCSNVLLIGSHASTQINKERVVQDLSHVTLGGLFTFGLLFLVLFWAGLWKYSLLLLPVFLGVGIALLATRFLFGSIHGLVLAFGVGIVGLCLDYGLHGWFCEEKRQTWKSNTIGLVTTGVVLLIMMFSTIPLLRQLMAFSVIGLVSAFLLTYGFQTWKPSWFGSRTFPLSSRKRKWKGIVVLGLILCALVGLGTIRPELGMDRLNFQENRQKERNQWVFAHLKSRHPLIEISEGHNEEIVLLESHEAVKFAREKNIWLETVGNYLPPIPIQQENLSTWREDFCEAASGSPTWVSPNASIFFQPFFAQKRCQITKLMDSDVPTYVSHLRANKEWLRTWYPRNAQEIKTIQAVYPKAQSLRQLALVFPDTLTRELRWMAPAVVLMIVGILLLYYRSGFFVMSSLLSFGSALGLITLGHWLFSAPYSFVSLVATLMVCGFSVDYGIFCTDLYKSKDRNSKREREVHTAVVLAVLTSLCGFIPLLWSHHPVLLDLGRTLTLGSLGAYLGAVWGIPLIVQWRRRK